MEKIQFAGELSFEDFAYAYEIHVAAQRWHRWYRLTLVLLILIGLGIASLTNHFTVRQLIPILLVPGMLLLWSMRSRYLLQTQWNAQPQLHTPQQGEISETGLLVTHHKAYNFTAWNLLGYYQLVPDLIIIYHNPYIYQVLPKAFFNSEQMWQSALQIIATKLPNTPLQAWTNTQAYLQYFVGLSLLLLFVIFGIFFP